MRSASDRDLPSSATATSACGAIGPPRACSPRRLPQACLNHDPILRIRVGDVGPPKGHPVPVGMSTPMSSALPPRSRASASPSTLVTGRRARGSPVPARHRLGLSPHHRAPELRYVSNSVDMYLRSTALPSHHQRVHGRICRSTGGHSDPVVRAFPVPGRPIVPT